MERAEARSVKGLQTMRDKPEICLRKGCGKPRQPDSDMCAEHTRKYYDRWTRAENIPHYGCGGGRRTPKVTEEGMYGDSIHSQRKAGDDDAL